MKLNLGSGKYPLEGYKNIDMDPSLNPDECYDIAGGINEDSNSVDEILISHTLMYFTPPMVANILLDCLDVLRPGGTIRITEDNALLKKRNVKQQEQYGDGVLLTATEMSEMLSSVGFAEITWEEPFQETTQHLNLPDTYPLASGRAAVYFLSAIKPVPGDRVVYLALDDFGEQVSQLDVLWKLRNTFDNFKVNLFAPVAWNESLRWREYVYSLSWIQMCVHGYNHLRNEELDDVSLDQITNNIFPYKKVYKAPFWELTDPMYEKLKKRNYTILLHKDDPREGIKYNWEIDKPPPEGKELHAYGHIYSHDYKSRSGSVGSSLFHNFENILKLPKNTKFRFYETN